jgi:hypothetical protein
MKPHLSLRPRLRSIFLLLAICLVLTASGANSMRVSANGEEWRPVDPADLALKAPVVEPGADAEAIFWDVRVDDGGENDLVLSHYVRIKIFTELGREQQSKIEIPFFGKIKIKDVAARTIKPDGSIVELTKEDIIEKLVVKASGVKLKTKSFAFPGIQPGAIVEYKWKEVIPNSSANNLRLQFQREIPVQAVTYRIKPASSEKLDVRAFNMERPQFQKEKNGFSFATMTKMPAFHEEPMMPPEDSVRSWATVRYENLFTLLTSYPFFAAQVQVMVQPYLKVDKDIKQKAEEIAGNTPDPVEKIAKILAYCRTSIKNTDDKNSGFSEEQLDKLKENKKSADTLKRGVGPTIDINLLFAALVNAQGMEARVALLPDRGRQFFERNVYIPGSLRPTTIAVRFGDSWKFFAPGQPYIASGMLRWQEEGVDALILGETNVWTTTPMSPPDKSKEKRVATFRLDENGTLEGDVNIEYTGHLAVERKNLNDDDSSEQRQENLKEALKNRLGLAELSNIVIENATDQVKPFIYKYHVRVPDYAQRTGKRLFVQPNFFEKGIEPLFTASTRKYPVYFHFPWSEEDRITIILPKGYVLDNAESPSPIRAAGVAGYEVKMAVTKDETTLIYNRTFFFGGNDSVLFPVQTYAQLKRVFDEVHKADNHIITLKQAQQGTE